MSNPIGYLRERMERKLKWPQLCPCDVGNSHNVGKRQELKRLLPHADYLAQIRCTRIKHSTAANESNLETTARHIHAPSSELVSTSTAEFISDKKIYDFNFYHNATNNCETGVNEDGLEDANTASDADPVGFMDIKQNDFTTVDSSGSDHNDRPLTSRPTNPNQKLLIELEAQFLHTNNTKINVRSTRSSSHENNS